MHSGNKRDNGIARWERVEGRAAAGEVRQAARMDQGGDWADSL